MCRSTRTLRRRDAEVIRGRNRSASRGVSGRENVLLLTVGNCFRDQVLDVCPELRSRHADESGAFQILEGSSLSTIRQMVASGAGITILPATSVAPSEPTHSMLEFRPFSGVMPTRDIVLASRRNFPRPAALLELVNCVRQCELPGVEWISVDKPGPARQRTRRSAQR